jgi:hypothetical protein
MKQIHKLKVPEVAPPPKVKATREFEDWEILSAYAHLSDAVEALVAKQKD